MYKVTKKDLDRSVERLAEITGVDYSLNWAYGGVRVVRQVGAGSKDVTVRGSKREIYNILRGMDDVAFHTNRKDLDRREGDWLEDDGLTLQTRSDS